MSKKNLHLSFLLPTTYYLLFTTPVFAALGTIDEVATKLCEIFTWVYTFALIFGVIFVLFAAFKYFTSGGDATKVSEAHKAILYAVVGIAVAILAKGIPLLIGNFLQAGTVNYPPGC